VGSNAWLYDGATTIQLGLTGAEHTRNDGLQLSGASQLNEASQVIGTSSRYNGATALGSSAWLYDGTTTIQIGLTGPEHTRNDGYKLGFFAAGKRSLNEAGHVIGYANRYNGGSIDLGYSVWLYHGATTVQIGLTGPEFTRNDGYKRSDPIQLNEVGQVIGTSYRYNGGIPNAWGQDAWFYDPVLDQTFPLRLSMRSDGYASSSAAYLGEDGLVLGTYALFDASDNYLGNRAFYFTVADGLHDLGALVDGGLTANGWDYLASAIRTSGAGHILGHGKLTSQSAGQMAYLLTPVAIPEPSTFILAAVCALRLYSMRRALNAPPKHAAPDCVRRHCDRACHSFLCGVGYVMERATSPRFAVH
jgi:hypothetical protein